MLSKPQGERFEINDNNGTREEGKLLLDCLSMLSVKHKLIMDSRLGYLKSRFEKVSVPEIACPSLSITFRWPIILEQQAPKS